MTRVAHDDGLALTELVAPDVISAVLAALLGRGAGRVLAVELLEHKPGRRALLRYETDGAGTVYGKAFPDATEAERTLDLMQRIAETVEAAGWAAPRPLGLVLELGLVLYEPLRGPSLDELVGDDAMLDALDGAGRWLATLHGSRLRLPRGLDVKHEAANAATWTTTAAKVFPDLAEPATRLTALLAGRVPAPVDAPVPIHKDFHYQHVIIGARVGVVDVDEARMGDRLFDVGHFLANLGLLSHRRGVAAAERDRWTVAFTRGCEVTPGDAARLQWYEAYTCVKLAKQLATGQGPRPRPDVERREAEAAWVLAHGLAVIEQ
jgi:aminoglycoside phosphotransferase (APT) family kinase protein